MQVFVEITYGVAVPSAAVVYSNLHMLGYTHKPQQLAAEE